MLKTLMQASSDLFTLDFDVPYSLVFFLTGFVEVLSVILIMATVTWQVLVAAFPVLIIVAYLQVCLFTFLVIFPFFLLNLDIVSLVFSLTYF